MTIIRSLSPKSWSSCIWAKVPIGCISSKELTTSLSFESSFFMNIPAYGWFNLTFLRIREMRLASVISTILMNRGKTGFLEMAMTGTCGQVSGILTEVKAPPVGPTTGGDASSGRSSTASSSSLFEQKVLLWTTILLNLSSFFNSLDSEGLRLFQRLQFPKSFWWSEDASLRQWPPQVLPSKIILPSLWLIRYMLLILIMSFINLVKITSYIRSCFIKETTTQRGMSSTCDGRRPSETSCVVSKFLYRKVGLTGWCWLCWGLWTSKYFRTSKRF